MPVKRARNFWAGLIPLPWSLPKGIKYASDDDLESTGDACERLSWDCGGVVMLGVLAEVALAWVHPPYSSFWEQWGSVIANAIVAAGVVGEVQFSMMAFRRDKELKLRSDEKVAAANERAREAQLEAERLKAQFSWRMLSPETINKLRRDLKLAPSAVEILFCASDPESQSFAMHISSILLRSGWTVRMTAGAWLGDIAFGLAIPPVLCGASFNLVGAFFKAEIPFTSAFLRQWESATIESPKGPAIGGDGLIEAQLYVGPKDPIFQEIGKEAEIISNA